MSDATTPPAPGQGPHRPEPEPGLRPEDQGGTPAPSDTGAAARVETGDVEVATVEAPESAGVGPGEEPTADAAAEPEDAGAAARAESVEDEDDTVHAAAEPDSGVPAPASLTPVFHTRVLAEAGLSPNDIEDLRQDYARGQMDLAQRAEKLRLDAVALEKAMDTLVDGSSKAHDAGLSVTTTHSRDSEVSRTEIVIGNTGAARKAPRRRSGGGFAPDRLLLIAVVVAVVGAAGAWLYTVVF
jgi:hypothetical protein